MLEIRFRVADRELARTITQNPQSCIGAELESDIIAPVKRILYKPRHMDLVYLTFERCSLVVVALEDMSEP